jgi:hypothetical protein
MLPGVTIEIGGREWTVPPLTLGQIRRLGAAIATLGTDRPLLDGETVGAIVTVVTAAMQRNYPDLTEDAVAELLDMATAPAVFLAVLTGSGFKRGAPGEDLAPAQAGAGTSSTASSPPPSATAPATSTN